MQKATVAHLQHLHIWQLSLNRDEWWNYSTSKPSKLVTVTRMPGKYGKVTSWHAAAFSDSAEPIPHTRPWPPRCQFVYMPNRCSSRTSLSSTPRPRPGNRDRSRLASSSRALPFKSWSLKSGEHMTFNSDMWISLIQNLANNAESDSCLQHLHIWQLSVNRDEWWNYRTSKPSKLVTVKGCRKHMKTEAFSGGLYRHFSDHDLNGRALDEDASLALSLFPGLGRGVEDKLVRHEHRFDFQRHWCRGRQGLVCGMGSAESLNAAACHDVTFPYFPGILWQGQVWMVWRCWSFVIHGWSRRLLRTCRWWISEWKCGFLVDCHCLLSFASERFTCLS